MGNKHVQFFHGDSTKTPWSCRMFFTTWQENSMQYFTRNVKFHVYLRMEIPCWIAGICHAGLFCLFSCARTIGMENFHEKHACALFTPLTGAYVSIK